MLDGFIQWEVSAQTGVKTMKGNDPIMHRGSSETNVQRGWGRHVSRGTKSSMTDWVSLYVDRSAEYRSRPFPCVSYLPAGVTRGSARSWKETR